MVSRSSPLAALWAGLLCQAAAAVRLRPVSDRASAFRQVDSLLDAQFDRTVAQRARNKADKGTLTCLGDV